MTDKNVLDNLFKKMPLWIDRAHSQAVKSGFHDEPKSNTRLSNLIISELFEAYEFFRVGWGLSEVAIIECVGKVEVFRGSIESLEYNYGDGFISVSGNDGVYTYELNAVGGYKVEGAAIDLADFLIRIFDFIGLKMEQDFDVNMWSDSYKGEFDDFDSLDDFINVTSADLAAKCGPMFGKDQYLLPTVIYNSCNALKFCVDFDVDIEKAIELKMAYNATRPYKHGKAF